MRPSAPPSSVQGYAHPSVPPAGRDDGDVGLGAPSGRGKVVAIVVAIVVVAVAIGAALAFRD
jgi:hypothetical protein